MKKSKKFSGIYLIFFIISKLWIFIRLKAIREKFYDLLVNCIPGEIIIKNVLTYLWDHDKIKNYDSLRKELVFWAAKHENKM